MIEQSAGPPAASDTALAASFATPADAAARHRAARYGVLPPRIRPGDTTGLVDTRRADQCPATILSVAHERALHTAA